MKSTCKHCGEKFIAKNAKFCSMKCYNDHKKMLEKRLRDALKNDTSHTKKFSED